MGFDNPIVGGTSLRIPSIHSPNYVAGSAGWTINVDGSAEFNNLTIRGTFSGNDFIINSDGIFQYSGTPATGNLVGSWAPAAGTDPFGNAFPQGISIKDSSIDTTFLLDGATGALTVLDNTLNTFVQMNGTLKGISLGQIDGPGQLPTNANLDDAAFVYAQPNTLGLTGAQSTASPSSATLTMDAGTASTGTGNANCPAINIQTSDNTSDVDIFVPGSIIKTDRTNSYSPFTWQTPVLGTGWSSGAASGTFQGLRYKRDAFDNLVVLGVIHSTSATPAGTIFTLPSAGGYRPSVAQRLPVMANSGGSYSGHSLIINTNGTVTVDPPFTVSNADLYTDVTPPLGHIN
jgi:hypothetical protein